MRRGGNRVHWGSLGSVGRALGVLGFIPARSGGGRFHSGLLGSFGRTLGVVGFILVRWVHS